MLVTEGFHTRRSYWSYRIAAEAFRISVIPQPLFTKYEKETWWAENDAWRDYISEFAKFIYYVAKGYIPLKSLYQTT